jgi:hypothetical protein
MLAFMFIRPLPRRSRLFLRRPLPLLIEEFAFDFMEIAFLYPANAGVVEKRGGALIQVVLHRQSLGELAESRVRIVQAFLSEDGSHHVVLQFLSLVVHIPQLGSQGLARYHLFLHILLILLLVEQARAPIQELLLYLDIMSLTPSRNPPMIRLRPDRSDLVKSLVHELVLGTVIPAVVASSTIPIEGHGWRRLDDHGGVFLSDCP